MNEDRKELDWTHCCTGKFNVAFSLCRVLGITLYFSEGFSEAAARGSAVTEAPQPLGETMVCFLEQESSLWSPAIEAQIVFEMLLALVTSQLAIADQLGREVHLWSVGLFLGSGGWR